MLKKFLFLLAVLLLTVPAIAGEKEEATGLAPFDMEMSTPQVKLPDIEGNIQTLKDYQGQVVVLNFWATWCAPCRKEMPSFARLQTLLEPYPAKVITINIGDDKEGIKQFLDKLKIKLAVWLDKTATTAQYWPMLGLPTTFVLDKKGDIIYKALGPREWDDTELLNKIIALSQ